MAGVGRNIHSDINGLAQCGTGSLHERFGERGVRMHCFGDFMRRRFQGTGRNGLCNQFGSVASYDVASKPFSILRIIDDLNESFRVAECGGLA